MVQTPLNSAPTRFSLPKMLWATWFISVLLLMVVGGTLVFFPVIAQHYWPWTLAPFNTRLLGAIYASAALPLIGYLLNPQPHYLRVVLPTFACFTTYLLLVSMGNTTHFLPRKASAIWFFLYGASSFVGLYFCWRLRQQLKASDSVKSWSRFYLLQAAVLGLYGLGLLLLSPVFGQWWPWPLNPFHAQLYSGILISAALAMILLRDRACTRTRIWFAGTQLCLGSLAFLGTWIVDLKVQKLDWSRAFPWLWQVIFLGFAGIGGWILVSEVRRLTTARDQG